jgi:hypothetical protein
MNSKDRVVFQTPSTIQSVRTLVDGGVKLDVITQELAPEELSMLFQLKGKLGYFVFSESGVNPQDIPQEELDVEADEKSASKRLRAVLFVYWKDYTSQKEPFDTFYKRAIEQEINKVKEKMN